LKLKQEPKLRKKTIIQGFKNSQKFRVIFKGDGSENDVGLYMTVQQMSDQFATVTARTVCWEAMEMLARMRRAEKEAGGIMPVGLGATIRNKQVQVDLV
jgi:hypothetical protein